MRKIMSWMLAAFFICGASAFTSCSNNDDNPVVDNSLAEKIVGKWIHADTDGEAVTTDMKSVYTFTKNGSALKGFYSMSMAESGVWVYRQETDLTISGNTITMTSRLADGQQSVVELTAVTVSGDEHPILVKQATKGRAHHLFHECFCLNAYTSLLP